MLHVGNKLDKAENFFTKLAPENFTKFVHLQVSVNSEAGPQLSPPNPEKRCLIFQAKLGPQEVVPRGMEGPNLDEFDLVQVLI